MGVQQEIHFESGLLTVDARGEFSLEEAKLAFLELLAAVAQYHAEKVLFDGRNLKGKPEHIELLWLFRGDRNYKAYGGIPNAPCSTVCISHQ